MNIHQVPSVGRIVHFYRNIEREGALAAIITSTRDGNTVDLTVFYSDTPGTRSAVPFSAEPQPACWSWPPRAP